MPKWSKDATEFTVSINYSDKRGFQTTIPKPIADKLGISDKAQVSNQRLKGRGREGLSEEKQLSYEQWTGAFHYFGSTEKHPRKLKQCKNGIHPVGEYCSNCLPWKSKAVPRLDNLREVPSIDRTVIVDGSDQRILGAHIIGPWASILIQEIVNVMYTESMSYDIIDRAIHIHPAMSEVIQRAFGSLMPVEHYHEHALAEMD